jgi:hypothetical protein
VRCRTPKVLENLLGDVACDGTHVWAANGNGNSVTELRASTGALVEVI